jgi:hypothetical protein
MFSSKKLLQADAQEQLDLNVQALLAMLKAFPNLKVFS